MAVVYPHFKPVAEREKEAEHGLAEVEVLQDDLDAGIVLPGLRRGRRDFDVMQQLPSGMMRLKTWYWPSISTRTQNLRSAQELDGRADAHEERAGPAPCALLTGELPGP